MIISCLWGFEHWQNQRINTINRILRQLQTSKQVQIRPRTWYLTQQKRLLIIHDLDKLATGG